MAYGGRDSGQLKWAREALRRGGQPGQLGSAGLQRGTPQYSGQVPPTALYPAHVH